MSRKNSFDEVEIGYHKQESSRVDFDNPVEIKKDLNNEINKLYPNSNFSINVTSGGIIECIISNDNDDPEFLRDGIEELVDSSFSDYEDYQIIVKLED